MPPKRPPPHPHRGLLPDEVLDFVFVRLVRLETQNNAMRVLLDEQQAMLVRHEQARRRSLREVMRMMNGLEELISAVAARVTRLEAVVAGLEEAIMTLEWNSAEMEQHVYHH